MRRHLADHAAAGRMLDELLTRADIILTADPVYLAATLGGIQRRGANAAAVLRCLQHLQSGNPDEKAKQLALAALQSGADELAFRAGALAASASWRPLWAWWRPANASRVVGELPSAARALTALATEQGALAIAGGDFGIEVWDIGSGRRLAAHPGNVHSVAVGHVARRAMLLAGHDDGMVSLHELPNLEILAHNLSEHSRAVRAAVIVGRGSMAATGDDDGAVVLWQLPALKALAKEPRAHARVTDLAAAVLDGTSLLISAGDTFENGYRDHDTQPVRAWALPGLSLHAEVETKTSVSNFLKAVSSPLGCIVVFQKGSGFAVKLVAADGTVKLVGARDSGWLSDLLVLREGDEPEIALLFETLEPLTINLTPVPALTLGPYVEIEFAGHWAGPVVLNERVILLSGGRTLRVWDLYDLLAASSPHADISHLAERQKVHYVEAIASASEVLAVLTSDGSVHRWLWRSGEALEPPLVVRREPIEAMANCILAGRPHFAVGYRDGIVEAFDAESAERWPALVDVAAPLHAMAVGEQDGRTVAATAVQLGFDEGRPFYGVRLWDLMTGEEIPTQDSSMVAADRARAARGLPTNDMLHWELVVHGYADKKLDLAVVEKDDYLLIVAHTSLGLTVWPLDATGIGEELRVDSPADLGAIAGRQGLLAVGDSNGRWGLWCLDAAHAVQGEHRGLAALAVGKRQGAPVLLSGGADGWVRVWSRDGDQIQSIDTGEWITSLAFMADDHIAVGTRRGVVVVQLTNSSSDTLSAIG
ncbi:hypothetical protein A5703_07415 [Mycobacterium sp. E188]|nr:hypothetical protein A5703_07415 [Mycobacterium sp. E188]OBH41095.1 hypothetical protein A5691_19410 [Mycobacterium sp. E183]